MAGNGVQLGGVTKQRAITVGNNGILQLNSFTSVGDQRVEADVTLERGAELRLTRGRPSMLFGDLVVERQGAIEMDLAFSLTEPLLNAGRLLVEGTVFLASDSELVVRGPNPLRGPILNISGLVDSSNRADIVFDLITADAFVFETDFSDINFSLLNDTGGFAATGWIFSLVDLPSGRQSIRLGLKPLDLALKRLDSVSPVPLPASAWLLLLAVAGLVGIKRRNRA